MGMKAGIYACLNRGPVANAIQQGELRVVVEIGVKGEVTGARAVGGDGLIQETIDCILRRVKSSNFLPPDPAGTRARLILPMTFKLVDDPGPVPL
jgi:hypothetical protein